MRHALIRLWRTVGLDVKWYVPEGHPTVFDITKRKIHNVLQGVAGKGVEMNDEDKKWFELWTQQNGWFRADMRPSQDCWLMIQLRRSGWTEPWNRT